MNRSLPITLTLIITLLTSGCFDSNKGLAPKNIKDKQISFLYDSKNPDFTHLAGKNLIYAFFQNLTYESYLDNKPYAAGNYAYNKTGPDSAELSVSYADDFDVQTQSLYLLFSSPDRGKFDQNSDSKDTGLGTGTFEIQHPSKDLLTK